MSYVIDLDKNIPEQIIEIGKDMQKYNKKPNFFVRVWNKIKNCF